jgi:hypothetical protein
MSSTPLILNVCDVGGPWRRAGLLQILADHDDDPKITGHLSSIGFEARYEATADRVPTAIAAFGIPAGGGG